MTIESRVDSAASAAILLLAGTVVVIALSLLYALGWLTPS